MTGIGKRIKSLRALHDMSQDELAEKIGTSKSSISGWETEVSEPNVKYIGLLCDLFRVTPNYLLGQGKIELLKLDERDQRMLSIYKEKMPEKMRDIIRDLASIAQAHYTTNEDYDIFFHATISFINGNALRKLWKEYESEDIAKDDVLNRRLYRRMRLREFIDQLLDEEVPLGIEDKLLKELELMKQEEDQNGDHL